MYMILITLDDNPKDRGGPLNSEFNILTLNLISFLLLRKDSKH